MNRKIIPFVIAGILVCLVMAVSGVFAFSGAVTAEKFGGDVVWSRPYSSAESMKVIDLTDDGKDDLFIQSPDNLTVLDEKGEPIFGFGYNSMKTTLGDVNGDNVEDIVVYHVGTGMSVDVISKGQPQTIAQTLNIGFPARDAVIRFSSGPQIVLGDSSGSLLALSPTGQVLWESDFGSEEVRGMDDARINGQVHVAVATHDGSVAVFDNNGNIVWQTTQEQLRRMRAFDINSDGDSEIITGGEYGAFIIYGAADGSILSDKSLGQAVSEVREVELDGDPPSREIVAGGKDGGVWAFTHTGDQLWSGSLSAQPVRVSSKQSRMIF